MLPEPLRLLISAYAAGDLTPRRREAAERLLRHSKEARKLLRELRENRRRLRALSRPELPPNFANAVLEKLPQRQPIIRPSPALQRRRHGMTGAIVTAAGIVVAVAVSAYLLATLPAEQSGPIAAVVLPKVADDAVAMAEPEPEVNEDIPAAPSETDRVVAKGTAGPPPPASQSLPQAPTPDPLGNVPMPSPQFVRVQPPRLPVTLAVREIDINSRQNVARQFAKSESLHVDLFCRDPARGLERLQAALKGRKTRVVVDGFAQELLKRKFTGQYLVYCDDLTANEWSQVFLQVANLDKIAESRKAGDGTFDRLVLLPLDSPDRKDLVTLFGSDPRSTRGKAETKSAFATAVFPGRSPAPSKESRQFLDTRKERVRGAITVVLIVRPLNA